MRGHRGYNICPWLKNGKHEICGKSCREEYCKDHRHKIRNRSRIPRPCLGCGIGVRSQIQLCRGCGRERERQRRAKTRVEPAQHRVCAEKLYWGAWQMRHGLLYRKRVLFWFERLKKCGANYVCINQGLGLELDTNMSGLRARKRKTKTLLFKYFIAESSLI